MIKYTKLQIEDNYLKVAFEVEDKPYYENVSIEGVRIDTPATYGTDTPYFIEDGDDVTLYEKEIFIPDVKKELLIITPQVYAAIPPDSPCGSDIVDKAVVYDKSILVNKGMTFLKELGDTCNIPREFIDFILRQKALEMAISTCNYNVAIKYWEMLTVTKGTTIKGCGCYGS